MFLLLREYSQLIFNLVYGFSREGVVIAHSVMNRVKQLYLLYNISLFGTGFEGYERCVVERTKHTTRTFSECSGYCFVNIRTISNYITYCSFQP